MENSSMSPTRRTDIAMVSGIMLSIPHMTVYGKRSPSKSAPPPRRRSIKKSKKRPISWGSPNISIENPKAFREVNGSGWRSDAPSSVIRKAC